MFNFFKRQREKPPYLDRIDELEYVRIARMKGNIDQGMVPVIEQRIQDNRKRQGGVNIDKNILIDYAKVGNVDTAAIAFNMVRLKEIQAHGRKIGFINVSDQLKTLLDMFKQSDCFQIYPSEEAAIQALNKE